MKNFKVVSYFVFAGVVVTVIGGIIALRIWQTSSSSRNPNVVNTDKAMMIWVRDKAIPSIGYWGPQKLCSNREKVLGYQIIKRDRGNSTLNQIVLVCEDNSDLTSFPRASMKFLKKAQYCSRSSYTVGFRLRYESGKGVYDVHMLCSDGKLLNHSRGAELGVWGSITSCPRDSYICGLKAQVYKDNANENITLNNVDFSCCVGIRSESLTVNATVIRGDAKTSFGIWGNEELCLNRSKAIGYQLRVEDAIKNDNTGLNTIQLYCDVGDGVTSFVGNWGSWKQSQYCSNGSYLIGFQLRSEEIPFVVNDHTAANDLHMLCSDGKWLRDSKGFDFGTWGSITKCPPKSYICGIRTQVQGNHGSDDTALNNVEFTCCFK